MANEETNYYLQALNEALTTIRSEIDTLSGDGGGLAARVTRHVAGSEGWVCSEADSWVEELTTQVSPVLTAFEDAWDHVNSLKSREISAEGADGMVDAGHPHGLAYRNGG